MRIVDIRATTVTLPFRFSFRHSLAARSQSQNVIVRATVAGTRGERAIGFGESVPREYVTGESVETAVATIKQEYVPRLLDRRLSDWLSPFEAACLRLREIFQELNLDRARKGASFCALELAIFDAVLKLEGTALSDALAKRTGRARHKEIVYGGVVPFGNERALKLVLYLYRLAGFKTVKLKVGGAVEEDLEKVRLAREILGKRVTLRVDANCAWSVDDTLSFCKMARPYGVASIEQPVPKEDFRGLKEISERTEEEIVADESLCTIEDARRLAEGRVCRGFNIRLSKVGGILPALAIAEIARANGINCHLGAQVGESGILTAAGRAFAAAQPPFANYEGAANLFLLRKDLVSENLTHGIGGRAQVSLRPGIGVTVMEERIGELAGELAREVKSELAGIDEAGIGRLIRPAMPDAGKETIKRGAHA
ncbi:MAG TPA: enolase C-terminal domain-like protein [Candidatus Obscuribacterales bacterium]